MGFLANCQEFSDVQLRVSEKKVLNELNKSKNGVQIRYPMKGKIKTSTMKVCWWVALSALFENSLFGVKSGERYCE